MFVDTTENGSELVRELKVNLPQFEWLAEDESDRALLTFTLQGEAWTLKTSRTTRCTSIK